MQQNNLLVTDEMEEAMRGHEEKGQTAVLIAIDGKRAKNNNHFIYV